MRFAKWDVDETDAAVQSTSNITHSRIHRVRVDSSLSLKRMKDVFGSKTEIFHQENTAMHY